jgi:hypothetical protein
VTDQEVIMIRSLTFSLIAAVLAASSPSFAAQNEPDPKGNNPTGKTCHMEQQCHWENFKKICTYVKVCR